MEPVAWLYRKGGSVRLADVRPDEDAELMAKAGWTETPLVPASALEMVREENERLRGIIAEAFRRAEVSATPPHRSVELVCALIAEPLRAALEDNRCQATFPQTQAARSVSTLDESDRTTANG